MKQILTAVSGCMVLMASLAAPGAVNIGMELEHRQVVQHEDILAFVTLENDSGIPLALDTYDEYAKNTITFEVVRDGKWHEPLPKRPGRIVERALMMPDERQQFMVDLGDWYSLQRPGRYFVAPELTWNGRSYKGKKVMLDVVNGFEIQKIRRAVPGYQDLHRDFRLIYWARDGAEYLFLRVDEVESGQTYGAIQLGTLVRVFEPKMEVDRDGKIEILHQASRSAYLRTTLVSLRNSVELEDQVALRDMNSSPIMRALTRGLADMDVSEPGSTAAQGEREKPKPREKEREKE